MTTADSLPSDLVPKVPALQISAVTDAGAIAEGATALFKLVDDFFLAYSTPQMQQARANVAAMKAQDKAATDADTALAGKDVTPLEDDLS